MVTETETKNQVSNDPSLMYQGSVMTAGAAAAILTSYVIETYIPGMAVLPPHVSAAVYVLAGVFLRSLSKTKFFG